MTTKTTAATRPTTTGATSTHAETTTGATTGTRKTGAAGRRAFAQVRTAMNSAMIGTTLVKPRQHHLGLPAKKYGQIGGDICIGGVYMRGGDQAVH